MNSQKIQTEQSGTGIGFKTHRDKIKEYYGGFWNPLLNEKFDCLVCRVACKERHQSSNKMNKFVSQKKKEKKT